MLIYIYIYIYIFFKFLNYLSNTPTYMIPLISMETTRDESLPSPREFILMFAPVKAGIEMLLGGVSGSSIANRFGGGGAA